MVTRVSSWKRPPRTRVWPFCTRTLVEISLVFSSGTSIVPSTPPDVIALSWASETLGYSSMRIESSLLMKGRTMSLTPVSRYWTVCVVVVSVEVVER